LGAQNCCHKTIAQYRAHLLKTA